MCIHWYFWLKRFFLQHLFAFIDIFDNTTNTLIFLRYMLWQLIDDSVILVLYIDEILLWRPICAC